jgi:biopolymer transport protein ExbB
MTPLLGLLGTVIGMISSFNVVAAVGMGKPEMLAGGISEALVNTAGGLAVAIPSLFAFNYFAGKKEAILMSIEKNVSKLLMRFEDFKKAEGKKKAPEA